MEIKSIAIDGPSGAGKSTLAHLTAKKYGLIYVDTGAIYRSVGLFAMKNNVGSKDEAGVTALLPRITVEMYYDDDGFQRMLLNGSDVTEEIRKPEASLYASDVSAMVPVRAFLLSMQREMAVKYDVIMDGRDIGTVVLPNAGLKIFLTAKAEIRAQRRYEELTAKNVMTSFEDVLRDIQYRDKNDSERSAAPLMAAEDAIIIDSSEMDLTACLERISVLVEERLTL